MLKQRSTLFLKSVLFFISTLIIFLMLWFPRLEGRNANSDAFSLYFTDPFLAYVYLGSIPFFIGIYQAIKLLNLIEQNKAFTKSAVQTLRNMKRAALTLMFFVSGVLPYLFFFGEEDSAPGVMLITIIIIFIVGVLATALAVFQKLFQNAVDLKEENDLTV